MKAIRRGCLKVSAKTMAALKPHLSTIRDAYIGKTVTNAFYKLSDSRYLVPRFTRGDFEIIRNIESFAQGEFAWSAERVLRPGQAPAIAQALKSLRATGGATLVAKCGSGKTVMGLKILSELRPAKTIVLVPKRDLVKQWAERILQFTPGVSFSFILPTTNQRDIYRELAKSASATEAVVRMSHKHSKLDRVDLSGRVVITTLQSMLALNIDPNAPLMFDTVVADEVHLMGADKFSSTMWRLCYRYSLGLTATPDRADGNSWVYSGLIGPVAVIASAVKNSPAEVHMVSYTSSDKMDDFVRFWCKRRRKVTTRFSCGSCTNKCLDYHAVRFDDKSKIDHSALLAALAADPGRNARILAEARQLVGEGRQLFIMTSRVDHVLSLYRSLVGLYGLDKVGWYTTKGPDEDGKMIHATEAILAANLAKQVTVCTYKKADMGLDAPHKDAMILALPLVRVQQAKGRIERTAPGKRTPILVDIVDRSLIVPVRMAMSRQRQYRLSGSLVYEE